MRKQFQSSQVPTPGDLDQAIQRYRASDMTGVELFKQWQAIRNAALGQVSPTSAYDQIAGEDSY